MLPRFFRLLSETEFADKLSVLVDIFGFKIIEQALSSTDHFQKTATRMIVVGIFGKVRVEMIDALGQKSYLNFGGTGVVFADLVRFDDCFLVHFFILHGSYSLLPKSDVEYSFRLGKVLLHFNIRTRVCKPF